MTEPIDPSSISHFRAAVEFLTSVSEAVISRIDSGRIFAGSPALWPEEKVLVQTTVMATIGYLTTAGIAADVDKTNELVLFLQDAVAARQAQS